MNSYIVCGDCLELMKDIPDHSVDMILCDLPYGTTRYEWDVIIPFEPLWEQYNRIIKDNGAIVLFGSQPFTAELIHSNLVGFRYEWIWEKQKGSNFMNAKIQPMKIHENILVFGKNTPSYYPKKYKVLDISEIESIFKNLGIKGIKELIDSKRIRNYGLKDRRVTVKNPDINKEFLGMNVKRVRYKDDGTRYPRSIIAINKSINKNAHPTQKPVALLKYLIETYTKENEIVLDNCMGSGSTCIAAIETGRRYIGIEKESKFYDIAKERIANINRQKESSINDQKSENENSQLYLF